MTEAGFVKAQSDNLPRVDAIMVACYFAESNNFLSAELRSAKVVRSGRDSYSDNAIGYVQVSHTRNICTVKARITPEHRIRNQCYTVTFMCDEKEEKILKVECLDCAASQGGCKHVVAFIMWLHRRSEEPSPTEITCYWKKSVLSSIGTSLKFVTVKSLGKTIPPLNNTSPNGKFLEDVVNLSKEHSVDNQLMSYYSQLTSAKSMSLHHLMFIFKSEVLDLNKNGNDFVVFCSKKMAELNGCIAVTLETTNQSNCPLWYEVRYGRITASKIYEVAHCKTTDGVLVEMIVGAIRPPLTKAMCRGTTLEKDVIQELAIVLKKKLKNCGLYLSVEYPIFGASPDAICEEFVVEVKCPMSEKAFKCYIREDNSIQPKYLAQIQMQMHLSNIWCGVFCVAYPDFEISRKVKYVHIKYNKEYCEYLIDKSMAFWYKAVFPILNQ